MEAGSYAPALSANGRYVLFSSLATNLVAGDTNGREDLFLHDRDADGDCLFDEPGQVSTRRVSVESDGSEATCRVPPLPSLEARLPGATPRTWKRRLSTDGRHMVFSSRLEFDAGRRQRPVGHLRARQRAGPDDAAESPSWWRAGRGRDRTRSSAPTGRIVAFTTADPGMAPYDSNGVDDVFAVDRDPDGNGIFDEQLPTFTHISLRPGGALYSNPLHPARDQRTTGAGWRTRRIRRWGSSIARLATTRSFVT